MELRSGKGSKATLGNLKVILSVIGSQSLEGFNQQTGGPHLVHLSDHLSGRKENGL